jgi:parvulin-like peptidyl-prolyl isomerase
MIALRIAPISFAALLAVLGFGASAHAVDLAKVNGRVITDRDLNLALGNLNEGQRASVLKDSSSRRQVLLSVVDQEILVQQAEKEKLDADADFKEAAAAFRRQYLTNRVLAKNLGAKLTESAAKRYYEDNKTRYGTDQVHALHILVREEPESKEVFKRAKGLSDDDFKDLAEKISKDPSAKNNRGDIGFIGRESKTPDFTDPVFAAGEGQVVGPIKTAYGYHIVKVLKKRSGKPLEFDEVKLRVESELRQHTVQNYVEGLKKQAKLEVDEKALEKM